MKKFITLVLVIVVVLSICPAITFAEEEFKEGIFTYTISGKEAIITNIDDTSESVDIPEKIGEYEVTTLAAGACGGSTNIKSVNIPGTVKCIDNMCFAYSTALREVTLEKGLKSIGVGAFYQCPQLWTITIPDGVEKIGENAFALCPNLTAVTIPSSVTQIDKNAFQKNDKFRIYAKPDTTAANYSRENGITFEEYITVNVNGADIVFDQPCITDTKNYVTLVPMRAVMEALKATVSWDESLYTAGIDIGENRLLVRPNEPFIMINGSAVFPPTPAVEFNERILLPIRCIIEGIGGKIGWNEAEKTITIVY